MSIFTINKKIAVIPPTYEKIETEVVGGFATISQKKRLLECKVVFSFELPDGSVIHPETSTILVAGDSGLQAWAGKVYFLDDKEFALVPLEMVIGINTFPLPRGNR